jgi:hypothetical protein
MTTKINAAHLAAIVRANNVAAARLTEIALKAWATRRANESAARLTAIALKAWATRRANEDARSAAAFQAWDTRDAA